LIDINEPLEGDITHRLKIYSNDLHFKHAFQALKKWGSNPDPNDLMQQIKYIEAFSCDKYSK